MNSLIFFSALMANLYFWIYMVYIWIHNYRVPKEDLWIYKLVPQPGLQLVGLISTCIILGGVVNWLTFG